MEEKNGMQKTLKGQRTPKKEKEMKKKTQRNNHNGAEKRDREKCIASNTEKSTIKNKYTSRIQIKINNSSIIGANHII